MTNKSLNGNEAKICVDWKEHQIRKGTFVPAAFISLVKLGLQFPNRTNFFESGLFYRCMDMQSFRASFLENSNATLGLFLGFKMHPLVWTYRLIFCAELAHVDDLVPLYRRKTVIFIVIWRRLFVDHS